MARHRALERHPDVATLTALAQTVRATDAQHRAIRSSKDLRALDHLPHAHRRRVEEDELVAELQREPEAAGVVRRARDVVQPADADAGFRVRGTDVPRVLVVDEQAVGADGDAHEHAVAHLAHEEAARGGLVAHLVRLLGARQLHLLHGHRALLLELRIKILERRRPVLERTHTPQRVVHRVDAAHLAARVRCVELRAQFLDLRLVRRLQLRDIVLCGPAHEEDDAERSDRCREKKAGEQGAAEVNRWRRWRRKCGRPPRCHWLCVVSCGVGCSRLRRRVGGVGDRGEL